LKEVSATTQTSPYSVTTFSGISPRIIMVKINQLKEKAFTTFYLKDIKMDLKKTCLGNTDYIETALYCIPSS
jgi:hypothetical protein